MSHLNTAESLPPERDAIRSKPPLLQLPLLCAIAFSAGLETLAAVENVQLKWSELGAVIEGRKIETVLVDGTALKGKAITVGTEYLELEIKETSNAAKYPKGPARVPRESLSVLQFTEVRGSWRAIGTAIGFFAGRSADKRTVVVSIVPE
ncbi:MAG: hypothetical protein ACE5JX_16430 [Acidobacteriota bacterium]